jgi:hypothetical protein
MSLLSFSVLTGSTIVILGAAIAYGATGALVVMAIGVVARFTLLP